MLTKVLIFAQFTCSLVAGHGKPAVFQGDQGGNGTALAVQGAVVQATGPNRRRVVTELDTTVFDSTKPLSDGMGTTTGQGKVKPAMIASAMALSGDTLPQASPGGTIQGVFHVVTSDGCGSVKGVLDTTATGKFSDGTLLQTTQDVPGSNGNCPRPITKKSLVRDVLERSDMAERRATNVNMDFPVAFAVPEGTSCTGTAGSVQNVCFVKMANTNPAGPYGGVVPIQIAAAGGATAASPAPGTNRRRAREFKS